MKLLKICLLFYNTVFTICLIVVGLVSNPADSVAPTLLLIPTAFFFEMMLVSQFAKRSTTSSSLIAASKRVLFVYSLLIDWLLIIASLASSQGILQASLTLFLLPLGIYYLLVIGDRRIQAHFLVDTTVRFLSLTKKARKIASISARRPTAAAAKKMELENVQEIDDVKRDLIDTSTKDQESVAEVPAVLGIQDTHRRQFLKILGGGGVSLVLMLFFMPQKASAAFFGSTPGPGIIGLKDSSGNKIDPAEKTPTDGYSITQIDDASTPSYYGFVHKSGAWYISKEDATGAYRYAAGASTFSTNWTNRASLTYNYFDQVF